MIQHSTFQSYLYQFKIIQNYYNNWNQDSNAQLTGIRSNWHPSKVSTQVQNQYLHCLIDLSFQDVSRFFILSFEDHAVGIGCNKFFIPKVETKDCDIMVEGKMFLINLSEII